MHALQNNEPELPHLPTVTRSFRIHEHFGTDQSIIKNATNQRLEFGIK
jgi:hypothetical protein